MRFFDLFSKRQKKKTQAGQPDVYTYDVFPEAFRIQVIHIWVSAIGSGNASRGLGFHYNSDREANPGWMQLFQSMTREKGLFNLADPDDHPFIQCQHFIIKGSPTDVLDIIEVSFRIIESIPSALDRYQREALGITLSPTQAIAELNHRFQEHSLGYEYINGEVVRKDSQYIHAEVVKPALQLLHDGKFQGAADEFLRAHQHYKAQNYKEALNEALKAFESTMKTICERRNWTPPPNATASALIETLVQHQLIPSELITYYGGLRSMLAAGVPTLRNRNSGHGQGATPTVVPEYLAAYALHMTAANIVFLIEAHNAK